MLNTNPKLTRKTSQLASFAAFLTDRCARLRGRRCVGVKHCCSVSIECHSSYQRFLAASNFDQIPGAVQNTQKQYSVR